MVCLRSLILLLSSFFLYFKTICNCNLKNPEDEMTEYQEKQWNIFICNVSFSLFNSTQVCSHSLPLILHSLHTVWSKSEHCSSYFFEIIRCPLVVVTSFWPLAVLILAITSQRSLENWMLQSPLSQQSRKLCLVIIMWSIIMLYFRSMNLINKFQNEILSFLLHEQRVDYNLKFILSMVFIHSIILCFC